MCLVTQTWHEKAMNESGNIIINIAFSGSFDSCCKCFVGKVIKSDKCLAMTMSQVHTVMGVCNCNNNSD